MWKITIAPFFHFSQFQGNTFIIKITHVKFFRFTSVRNVKCIIFTMSNFHNISKFPLNYFSPYKLTSQDKRLAAILIQKFCCCVPHSIVFLAAGNIIAKQHLVWWVLYLLPLMSLQFFFEYAWNWYSVITGYNDELLFQISAWFDMSFGTLFYIWYAMLSLLSGCNSKVYQQVCEVI